MRKTMLASAAAGATLLSAAAIYYFREKATPGPDYRVLSSDGDLEIRLYPAMVVAETVVRGPRKEALRNGFRILADYIFAKSRDGEALPMTVPVLQDGGDPMASDPPVFDDMVEGGWRMRFVMPVGRTASNLPKPPPAIDLWRYPPVGSERFCSAELPTMSASPSTKIVSEVGWLGKRSGLKRSQNMPSTTHQ